MKKIIYCLIGFIIASFTGITFAQSPSVWYPVSNYLKPVSNNWGLLVPGLATSTTGCLSVASNGWISASGSVCGGSGVWPFTTTDTNYGVAVQSTTTPEWFKGSPISLMASSTAVFVYASSTALSVSGNSYLGTVASGIWNGTAIGDAYISSAATWNAKQDAISATWPITLSGATLGFNGLSTSTAAVVGNIPYFSGVNTFANVATSTIGAGTGLSFSGTSGYQIGGANGTFSVNTSQNIATLSNLTTNGFVKTGGGVGTLSVDTTSYLSGTVGVANGGTGQTSLTSSQLLYGDGTNAVSSVATSSETCTSPITCSAFKVVGSGGAITLGNLTMYPAFSYSTSTSATGTTTIPLGVAMVNETWVSVSCFTDVGTWWLAFDDGTNVMDYIQASTTVGVFTLSTNNSFTTSEKRYVKIGNPASSPKQISCTVKKTLSAN